MQKMRLKPLMRLMALLTAGLTLLALAALLGFALSSIRRESSLTVEAVTEGRMLRIDSRALTVSIVPLQAGPEAVQKDKRREDRSNGAAELLSAEAMESLAQSLGSEYPLVFRIAPAEALPERFYDPLRGQYRVDQVLDWLAQHRVPGSYRTIGVLAEDVYAPGFNFLFGLSQLGGWACVASTARMGGSLKQGRRSPEERWQTIVRHELGHSLGLKHSTDKRSVMAFSNSLEELDQASDILTSGDWQELKRLQPVSWQRH